MGLNLLRSLRAYYYACISFIDFQVGRVLDNLEATGQADNTLILFTSDHGEHLGDYNCFGKRSMHDTCARIPLLACWPGRFTPGQQCDVPAGLLDVASTILEAAGTDLTTHRPDGVSLLARAGGADQPVFAQYERGDEAVYMAVTDRWKYAYSAPDNREFLFDRIGDPHETRNRAEVQFLAQEQADMRSLLIDHLTEGGETENIENGSWRKTPLLKIDANPDALLRTVEHGLVDMTIPGYRD
jgi:arylsulfatase A-like enzyme